MKIELEMKYYPQAGIKLLRKHNGTDQRFVVVMDCCGKSRIMSRSNVLERIRTGAQYVDKHGHTIPCISCSKTKGEYCHEYERKGRYSENKPKHVVDPIFKQIKIPDWPSRPGDRGYRFWRGSAG